MSAAKTAAALTLGMVATLSMAALAQNGDGRKGSVDPRATTIVLDELATVDWIEISDIAALREGVIDTMELQIGMPAIKGGKIGTLKKEIAELTVAKNQILANNTAAIKKAEAQIEVAFSTCARNKRLNERKPGMVSAEEVAKNEGELKAWEASRDEAIEQVAVNKAELNLAKQILAEHTIVAPFDGLIIQRMKNRGESVRANEAVVKLGNLSRLCANTYVPLEFAYRVKEGQVVDIQPRITSSRGEPLPVENKKFRGKITFVDPQIQPIAETAVRIRAEFENTNFELRPGLNVQMTIYLTQDVAAANPAKPQ